MVKLLKQTTYKEFIRVNEKVAKTSPMSSHYNSRNYFEKLLWKRKKMMIKEILDELKINDIIELGCGDAGLVDVINPKISYTGLDISPTQVKNAKKHINKINRKNAVIYQKDILDIINDNHKYDAALLCDVIEHVLDPEQLLKNTKKVVKRGGYILISIPNESIWQLIRLLALRFPPRSPDHLYAISPKDIEKMFPNVVKKSFIPFGFTSRFSLIRILLVKND